MVYVTTRPSFHLQLKLSFGLLHQISVTLFRIYKFLIFFDNFRVTYVFSRRFSSLYFPLAWLFFCCFFAEKLN